MQTTEGYKRPSGCVDFNKPLCSINYVGDLRLSTSLISSKRLRFEICIPVMPFLEYLLGKGDFWLSHTMLLLQHGAIVTASPTVTMEMLFVDSVVGLRFLLFEGCLKQAVALIFLILTVFNQPTEQRNVDMQLPETSIRFRLSSIQDLKKQHLFAFYSFSKLKNSKWLCLDSKLLQHCVLMKRLLVSECTCDNIKALEHGSFQIQKPCVGLAFEGLKKKAVPGILPMGVCREFCKIRMSQAAFNFSSKLAELPPFAFSFTAAPAFFMTLHLKLLMDQNFASVNLQDHEILCTLRTSEISCQPTADDCTPFESCLVNVQDKIAEHNNVGTLLSRAPTSVLLSSSEHELGKDVSISNVVDKSDSSGVLHKEKSDSSETTGCSKDFEKNATECNDQMHEQRVVITPKSIKSPSSNPRHDDGLSGMSVEVPSLDQVDTPLVGRGRISRQISDVGWNMSDGPVHSPNPTGPRSSWQRGRSSSSTAPFEDLSPVWYDGKGNFMVNGFSNGPKKPRTQVQYTLPFGGYDVSAKQKIHSQRVLPCKRIRRANEKRIPDGSRSSQRNLELLACGANVLVTLGDKGWRECGAQVVLELSDHNEWRLAIKLSGNTKYSFKVQHILQPGSTNRYTHAMMWKGGKDWVLEFPDRSQWMLFKEMHEECYNRNIRAASVKNIPIPGVRLIEESDNCGTQVPFVRNPLKYFQQVQTDVEMAMDSSRILYDMDSDDEQWLMTNKQSLFSDDNRSREISDELFDKTMNMLEKVSYVRHRNHFTYDELEELMAGIGSKETAKVIYEHWRQKRERMGMPLIRQLQPPLWERYEQQLKEWEHAVARGNTALSSGFQENISPLEKPPMFAFCLKPRGLDLPNKGSKQRSHRKFPASGYNHTVSGDQYGLHASGRRSSGFAFGDQKGLFPVNVYDSADASPLLQASTRVLSPRDAGGLGNFLLNTDVSEWNRHTKFYNNKPKKHVSYSSYNNQHIMASYNKRTGNINGVPQRNTGLPEWSSQKPHYFDRHHRLGVEQLDGSDLREFRLRDASGAAQHARNMAKLKKEKAQRLLYRADLAIHKAVVALMTADAIKAASNSNGSG
ncbi:Enhancer of polycomb-like transcription factor protein [Forsythia ovata]|uniref:Enhancer of polycomb-like protein n=1 Tax=Forsythia ovata TaxID=205694 RepID=A0ABD1W5K2_9LAMI